LRKDFGRAYNLLRTPMWSEIALGSLLVLVTTFVHAAGTVVALKALKRMYRPSSTLLWRAFLISSLVLGMFLVSVQRMVPRRAGDAGG
jgi:hypothetical protein